MVKRRFILPALLLLLSFSAFAADYNRSALTWVLYDDRQDFRDAEALERAVLMESFLVPPSQIYNVPRDASFENLNPTEVSFEKTMEEALDPLCDESNPLLLIAIDSHGLQNFICRQDDELRGNIAHVRFINLVFQKIENFNKTCHKDLSLKLFLDTCYSGTILNPIQNRIQNDEGPYSNGDDTYQHRVDLYASTGPHNEGYGNYFWDAFQKIYAIHQRPFCKEDGSIFCAIDYLNSHHLWSSYEPVEIENLERVLPWLALQLQKNKNGEEFRLTFHAIKQFKTKAEPLTLDLLKLSEHLDPNIRAGALQTLSDIHPHLYELKTPLIKIFFEDKNWMVRTEAGELLLKMGDQVTHDLIIQDLMSHFSPDDFILASLLTKFGRAVVPHLTPYLRDQRLLWRMQTLHILEEMGTEARDALFHLVRFVGSYKPWDFEKELALTILGRMGEYGKPAIPFLTSLYHDKKSRLRVAVGKALIELGPYAEEALSQLMEQMADPDESPALKEQMVRIFGAIGAASTVPLIIPYLSAPEDEMKQEAISALADIGPEASEAVTSLISLSWDVNPTLRRSVIEALVDIAPDYRVVMETLSDRALHDGDAWVRQVAIQSLSKCPYPTEKVIYTLGEALLSDGSEECAYTAGVYLSRLYPVSDSILIYFARALATRTDKAKEIAIESLIGFSWDDASLETRMETLALTSQYRPALELALSKIRME